MIYFFTLAAFVYLLLHLYFRYGLAKSLKLSANNTYLPPISVIVAARNEEQIIKRCVDSLRNLVYDPALLEIIIVNDKSTDNTKSVLLNETKNDKRFKVIDSRSSESTNLKGKTNALDTAIEICKGEIILLTDADCEVSPEWASEYVKYYDESTGMVCGLTNINKKGSLFSKAQSIDLVYLLSLASASCGTGNMLSCIGNNITFRKDAYLQTGGYGKISFSITEDLALMKAIYALKDYTVKFPVDLKCLVNTDSCPDIKSLLSQKKRWLKGGLQISLLGYLLGGSMYTMNVLLLTGYLYLSLPVYLALISAKIISELILILPVIYKLRLQQLLKYYLLYQIYFCWYGVILPFSFLFGRKVLWKGRKF